MRINKNTHKTHSSKQDIKKSQQHQDKNSYQKKGQKGGETEIHRVENDGAEEP